MGTSRTTSRSSYHVNTIRDVTRDGPYIFGFGGGYHALLKTMDSDPGEVSVLAHSAIDQYIFSPMNSKGRA